MKTYFYLALMLASASALAVSCRKQGVRSVATSLVSLKYPPTLAASSLNRVRTIRAGASPNDVLVKGADYMLSNTSNLYNGLLLGLAATAVAWKVIEARSGNTTNSKELEDTKPQSVKSLQFRFLLVFWLMRMADWLQGPYFYAVYSSKVFNGVPVSLDLVSKLFLVGFATTGIFGPWIGRFVDTVGRKAGTLAYAVLYAIGALTTRSNQLATLFLGRFAGGLGTSLLFSAPEAWLVGEYQRGGADSKWLGQTFGWAYAGDSLVAIAAGQLASLAADREGPSGPFTLSVGFLLLGAVFTLLKWKENVATSSTSASSETTSSKPSIREAINVMVNDKRIMLLGAVQALFEGAMYIFVLQWSPVIKAAIQASSFGVDATIPYGNIFSCFMASCLLGSTAFGTLQKNGRVTVEKSTSGMLLLATVAIGMVSSLVGTSNLGMLTAAMFLFELCVGMYFPSIGTLRSKYLPDSHRSVIMNLFGIPLNLIVVSVFLSMRVLGEKGALQCASVALGLATVCIAVLNSKSSKNSNSDSPVAE